MFKVILLTLLLFVSASVYGDEPIVDPERAGLVVAARGVATNGTGHPVLQGSTVYVGDTITTDDKSFVVIQFYDGAKITVKPSSEIYIHAYSPEKAQLDLVSGGLRVITGAMAKSNPENYTVKTPVALMGVRGTEFSIMLCEGEVCEVTVKD
jgi:hypothetical protein